MSFAIVHQTKNKEPDSKRSTPAKHSPHHHINSLAMDSHDSVIHLQRTIGNQAVQGLMQFDSAKIRIQAKLKVSQPGDTYEQEADRVAEKVMRMSASDHCSPRVSKEEERVDHKCSACEMKKEKEGELNITRKLSTSSNLEMTDEITDEINGILSRIGSSLHVGTRELMESSFAYDFSSVRIDSGEMAARSAASIDALAYTVGDDIVFGERQYKPHTLGGEGYWHTS